MKFTKLCSSALVGATVLTALAPTASFAATENNNGAANGGTELPQKANTKLGVSFGDPDHNGNTGYLRLQKVPAVLDFGNHRTFDSSYTTFLANGANLNKKDNDVHPGYKGGDNQTYILNTSDAKLKDVDGKVWATVVDKQTTRVENTAPNTAESGSWELAVKADGPLVVKDDAGNPMEGAGNIVDNATLTFGSTKYGRTLDVYNLTQESQDKDYAETEKPEDLDVSKISNSINLQLTDGSKDVSVATAADKEGKGANVFGWDRTDVKLVLPSTSAVKNAVYETDLTWTLKSTI